MISFCSASSTVMPGAMVTLLAGPAAVAAAAVGLPSTGRCDGSIDSPRARIVARSMTLRNSRTLPGQS